MNNQPVTIPAAYLPFIESLRRHHEKKLAEAAKSTARKSKPRKSAAVRVTSSSYSTK